MNPGDRHPLAEALALAPLVPIAAAVTAGLVADRTAAIPVPVSLILALAGLAGWWTSRRPTRSGSPIVWLTLSWAGLAAAYHHLHTRSFAADDIGNLASDEPELVRVRGTLDEEPVLRVRRTDDPLVSLARVDTSVSVLQVTQVQRGPDWHAASGRAQLRVEGKLDGLHVGDEVEVFGWLTRPRPPLNPGERDHAAALLADRIRAELFVRKSEQGVVRLAEGWRGSFFGRLGSIHGWARRSLAESIGTPSPLAITLLLGEGSPMAQSDWEKYVRTGVIHALAISGQHLVVLGAFLWSVLHVVGLRRRRSAWVVASVLLGYALLTGGRPSAMRAAVMVCAVCAAILLRRRALPANTLALSWIVVLAIDPTDLFAPGFQLSFLAVSALVWGVPRMFPPRELSAVERLVNESRTPFSQATVYFGRGIVHLYRASLVLGLATAPLIAYWQNLVSPVGLLIGPPVVILSSVALIAGFLLLLALALGGLLAAPFAWVTEHCLAACDGLVTLADRLPGGCWYVGDVPLWWVVGFYGLAAVWLVHSSLFDRTPRASVPVPAVPVRPFARVRWGVPTLLLAWTSVGLLTGAAKPLPDELRVTFLAVGHGNCTVIETPDGRCILYDAGTLSGPDVTRRQVAPFLWSRGVRRIDEVLISHADLDHFNGLPDLFERFTVGQLTLTPTFADGRSPAVDRVLRSVERHGVLVRVTRLGDHIVAGDVEIEVLHPPSSGPEGPENARSMVLLVRHLGHTLLLTGDLEKDGLEQLLAQPPRKVDLLMAPHHGSAAANTERLVDWCRPRLAVSSQGPPRWPARGPSAYERANVPMWRTFEQGAVTLRSHRTGLVAETFKTRQRLVVRPGSGPDGR